MGWFGRRRDDGEPHGKAPNPGSVAYFAAHWPGGGTLGEGGQDLGAPAHWRRLVFAASPAERVAAWRAEFGQAWRQRLPQSWTVVEQTLTDVALAELSGSPCLIGRLETDNGVEFLVAAAPVEPAAAQAQLAARGVSWQDVPDSVRHWYEEVHGALWLGAFMPILRSLPEVENLAEYATLPPADYPDFAACYVFSERGNGDPVVLRLSAPGAGQAYLWGHDSSGPQGPQLTVVDFWSAIDWHLAAELGGSELT